jgi:hypothetical protein
MLGPCSPSSSFFPQPGIVISAPVACWVQTCTSIVLVIAVTRSSFFLSSHSSSPSLWRKRQAGPGRLDTAESHLAAQRSAHWLGGRWWWDANARTEGITTTVHILRSSLLSRRVSSTPSAVLSLPSQSWATGERARGSPGGEAQESRKPGNKAPTPSPAQHSAAQSTRPGRTGCLSIYQRHQPGRATSGQVGGQLGWLEAVQDYRS